MGGKSQKPETLSAADMVGLARHQSDINQALLRGQTRANRPEQVTPYGRTVWEELGDDRWRQTTTITPDEQRSLDAQLAVKAGRGELSEQILGRAAEDLADPVAWEAMDINELGDVGDIRQSAEEALYGRMTGRLDPRFGQRRDALESQLWNQGLRPGDEAYDTAMANLGREETDAYQAAMNESIMGGGREAQRQFDMGMQRRQQAITEALKRRGVTINEINALLAGQQVSTPEFANFMGQERSANVDLVGAAQAGQQNEWDRYSARQAEKQGTMEGIMGTAAAVAPFFMSDRRLKSDIVHIGHTLGGQRVYEYTIFGRREIGVMAQESPPEAVRRHSSGFLMVDYSRIR